MSDVIGTEIGTTVASLHTEVFQYDMPDGTYTVRSIATGQWEVLTPHGTQWQGEFPSRFEATMAVVRGGA